MGPATRPCQGTQFGIIDKKLPQKKNETRANCAINFVCQYGNEGKISSLRVPYMFSLNKKKPTVYFMEQRTISVFYCRWNWLFAPHHPLMKKAYPLLYLLYTDAVLRGRGFARDWTNPASLPLPPHPPPPKRVGGRKGGKLAGSVQSRPKPGPLYST